MFLGDLASRNILCKKEDGRWVAKVAGISGVILFLIMCQDFGMSRLVNNESTYDSQSKVMPVRVNTLLNFFIDYLQWTSPEALQSGKFSAMSDVYSFGVVLWVTNRYLMYL